MAGYVMEFLFNSVQDRGKNQEPTFEFHIEKLKWRFGKLEG